ncbi:MAG: TolC family protein [Vicinamibacterales bacterium]
MKTAAGAGVVALALCGATVAAQAPTAHSLGDAVAQAAQTAAAPARTITLTQALAMARTNSPELAAAAATVGTAQATRADARSALLPSLRFNSSYIYTQPNGTPTGVFTANNGENEYIDQANVHSGVGVAEAAGLRSANAALAAARAEAAIAQRGLVYTVVQRYDAMVVAERKLATAGTALQTAQRFAAITRDRERGGEAAQADVIKADITVQQRQRELREAELALHTGQNELAIVILPAYDTNFAVADDLAEPAPLPPFASVQTQAERNNPALAAAAASLRQADQDIWVARGEILPSVSFDYFYGLDSNQFAATVDGYRNLGSSVVASLNVPLWNWGATGAHIAAARLRAAQAQIGLSFAARQLQADMHSFYEEAQAAREELDSLKQSVDLASESLRLTTLRYQAGEANVLEVVDAQTTLTDAQNAHDDGLARYHLALANLQTLTGIL